jgi:hypothetical protein
MCTPTIHLNIELKLKTRPKKNLVVYARRQVYWELVPSAARQQEKSRYRLTHINIQAEMNNLVIGSYISTRSTRQLPRDDIARLSKDELLHGTQPIKAVMSCSRHYRNPALYRVPAALPSAFYRALGKVLRSVKSLFNECTTLGTSKHSAKTALYRALGKADFAECRPRQSPAIGKSMVYRAPGTRHRQALGKDCRAEGQALGKHDARQRAVSGRLPLTAVSLCRVSNIWHSANIVFAECPL